jgi:hypothetical protein
MGCCPRVGDGMSEPEVTELKQSGSCCHMEYSVNCGQSDCIGDRPFELLPKEFTFPPLRWGNGQLYDAEQLADAFFAGVDYQKKVMNDRTT